MAGLGAPATVHICVVGDDGVGKTSLITAAATETFPDHPPPVLPPAKLPADTTPEGVPVVITDTSSRPEDKQALELACQVGAVAARALGVGARRGAPLPRCGGSSCCRAASHPPCMGASPVQEASVIVLCFSMDRPATLRRVASYWMPELRRLGVHVPVMLVGCKSDVRPADRSLHEVRVIAGGWSAVGGATSREPCCSALCCALCCARGRELAAGRHISTSSQASQPAHSCYSALPRPLAPASLAQAVLPIVKAYPQIETCMECSARKLQFVGEVFYYALKAGALLCCCRGCHASACLAGRAWVCQPSATCVWGGPGVPRRCRPALRWLPLQPPPPGSLLVLPRTQHSPLPPAPLQWCTPWPRCTSQRGRRCARCAPRPSNASSCSATRTRQEGGRA